jgi:hypothetical protein
MQGAGLPTLPSHSFRQCRHVVGTRALGALVLLDLASDRYITLRDVAATMWELILEGLDPLAMVGRLCEEYDVSATDVTRDLAAQLEEWNRRGWIEPQRTHSPPPPPVRRDSGVQSACDVVIPSVLRCTIMIIAVKVLLRTLRFGGTIGWLRSRMAAVPVTRSIPRGTVADIAWAVAVAGALYPGRARCLEQSLVLYYHLRCSGVAATYCHGVQPFPFRAHAWVEYEGQPVNDVAEHTCRYSRLPDLLP